MAPLVVLDLRSDFEKNEKKINLFDVYTLAIVEIIINK